MEKRFQLRSASPATDSPKPAPVATCARKKGTVDYADDDDRYRRQAMAGWPLPGTEIRVVDAEMQDVPRDMATHRRSRDPRR